MAAPVLPTAPAATSTCPNVPLWRAGSARRIGLRGVRSSASQRDGEVCARTEAGMPMSATISAPTWSHAGGRTWPYLGAAKVTVKAAFTAAHPSSPESEGTPEGMSTATTGTSGHERSSAIASAIAPVGAWCRPVPRSASTATSAREAAVRTRSHPASSVTSTSAPPERSKTPMCRRASPRTSWRVPKRNTAGSRSRRWRAITNPSPPLLPLPHRTRGRRACG
jgi:hypothetical protein